MGGCGVTETPQKLLSIDELFDRAFPEYLAMGMTYEQFWKQDCSLVIAYRKAYKLRQEEINRNAWLQGLYIFKALQTAPVTVNGFAPKGYTPEPYPNKPFDFAPKQEKTAQEKADEEAQARAERIKAGVMSFMQARDAQKHEAELKALLEDEKEGVSKDV